MPRVQEPADMLDVSMDALSASSSATRAKEVKTEGLGPPVRLAKLKTVVGKGAVKISESIPS